VTTTQSELDLTIFIPCYNEEQNIVPTLEVLLLALAGLKLSWEVIIIDDASSDRTVENARAFIQTHPESNIQLKVCEQNQGLAHNYVDGAMMGKGKYYNQVCGDNVADVEALRVLFQQIGTVDILIPYAAQTPNRPWFRLVLSSLYTAIVNLISGHRLHYYNGLPIHLRTNVIRWHSNYYGFGYQADLLIRLIEEGATYREVPVTQLDRKSGDSKALTAKNLLSIAHFFMDLIIRRIGNSFFGKEIRRRLNK